MVRGAPKAQRTRWPPRGRRQPRAGSPTVEDGAQPLYVSPGTGQPAVPRRAKALEQVERAVDSLWKRRLEPSNALRLPPHARMSSTVADKSTRWILGLAVRPRAIALVPQPDRHARPEPRGTARTLVRGVLRDPFGLEAVDGALGIVTGNLMESSIDDRRDAGNRERRFRDVRRQDDPPARGWRDRRILGRRVERPVKLDDLDSLGCGRDVPMPAPDLGSARKKAQNLTGSVPEARADRVSDGQARRVSHVEREDLPATSTIGQSSRYVDTAAASSVADMITRRRSDRRASLLRQRDAKIRVHAALVELVEDDGAKTPKQWILLQPCRQDALGGEQHPGRRTEPGSNRTCHPTSLPIVQPRSAAMRVARLRAATRRGWSTITGPSTASAGGRRVVLPAPGAAVTTTARDSRTLARISGMAEWMGRTRVKGVKRFRRFRRFERPEP